MSPTGSTDVAGLPTRADDPRLQNWYHTIELGDGLVSRGAYDHRTIVDRYGIPESLRGKTALDIGTFDGFWAFEMESRGADRVVAIDVATIGDFDWLPAVKAGLGAAANRQSNFPMAKAMRRSRVERVTCSVYDLSPETVGVFDVVFCGDVLLHLHNPLGALIKIRAVTKEMAVIQTSLEAEIEKLHPDKPWLGFGMRRMEKVLGSECTYWFLTTQALSDMMAYAGFARTLPQEPFAIPPQGVAATSVVGYVSEA
jgi:tRNA (mo5U34)-methyltransferase